MLHLPIGIGSYRTTNKLKYFPFPPSRHNLFQKDFHHVFTRTFSSSSTGSKTPKSKLPFLLGVGVLSGICLQQIKPKRDDKDVKKWVLFNQKLQGETKGKIPPPYEPIVSLAEKYLQKPSTILDVGCETGKNAAWLIKKGHKVVLLDIAPNAVNYTIANLKREGLEHGIQDKVVSKIEDLNEKYGPYQAVVGTYAFSFIPPQLFEKTMKEKVLSRIEKGGYFAGGFFEEQHCWSAKKDLSILTAKKLESLFSSTGFSIIEMNEQIKEASTVAHGMQKFHTINVIAFRS